MQTCHEIKNKTWGNIYLFTEKWHLPNLLTTLFTETMALEICNYYTAAHVFFWFLPLKPLFFNEGMSFLSPYLSYQITAI